MQLFHSELAQWFKCSNYHHYAKQFPRNWISFYFYTVDFWSRSSVKPKLFLEKQCHTQTDDGLYYIGGSSVFNGQLHIYICVYIHLLVVYIGCEIGKFFCKIYYPVVLMSFFKISKGSF